jgi:3-hydroxyacyl-[acyl-carrier-protein] dehydratase
LNKEWSLTMPEQPQTNTDTLTDTQTDTQPTTSRDIAAVMNQLPHRPPFLLVDRVLSVSKTEGVVALKNVTINEPFFVGHFPGRPIMPGVLIIEALAQASMFLLEGEFAPGTVAFLAGVDNARFRQPVVPGDQVLLLSQLVFFRRGIGKVRAQAKVGDVVVAEAELTFAVAKS